MPCFDARRAIRAIGLLSVLLLAAFSGRSYAADLALEAGGAILHGETRSIALAVSFGEQRAVGHDRLDFKYECGAFVNGETDRSARNAGAQCLVINSHRYLDIGFGLAYLQKVDAFNGSHLNFALLARLKLSERWAITLDNHISNGGTVSPNIGRDMFRLRWVITR